MRAKKMEDDQKELDALRWERKTLENIVCPVEEFPLKIDRLQRIDTKIAYYCKKIKEREAKAYVR